MKPFAPAIVLLLAPLTAALAQPAPQGRRALPGAYRCEIAGRLAVIHGGDRSTSRDRFITLWPERRPDAYVQCIFEPGDARLVCEASAHDGGTLARLPGDAAALEALGFRRREGENWRRVVEMPEPPDFVRVADLMLGALHDGFGIRPPVALRIRSPLAGRHPVPVECVPTS